MLVLRCNSEFESKNRGWFSRADHTVDKSAGRPGEFHPQTCQDPDLTLSRHPARATARRLPPSIETSGSSRCRLTRSNGDGLLPSLHGHYTRHRYAQSHRPYDSRRAGGGILQGNGIHSGQRGGRIFVKEKRRQDKPPAATIANSPENMVIVGGGAGFVAAEMLRRRGFGGRVVILVRSSSSRAGSGLVRAPWCQGQRTLALSHDAAPPVDRPNLSKLTGSAPEDWLPLGSAEFYTENNIELRLDAEVVGVDTKAHQIMVAGGKNLPYGRRVAFETVRPSMPISWSSVWVCGRVSRWPSRPAL